MRNDKNTGKESAACSCCSAGLEAALKIAKRAGLSRRNLLLGAGTAAVGSWILADQKAKAADSSAGESKITPAKQLIVQPVLTYQIHQRKPQTSWRPWGGLHSEADVVQEAGRIESELQKLVKDHRLEVKILPLIKVSTEQEAERVKQSTYDVILIYASGASGNVLDALVHSDKPIVFFLRHRSGPISRWYEILHPSFLRKATDKYQWQNIDVQDVVVDDYSDLAWRLRALAGLRKTLGQRIVAIGDAAGWGIGGKYGPVMAREKWYLDIVNIQYPEVATRIEKLKQNSKAVQQAAKDADRYLQQTGIELHTDKKYVRNAFLLYRIFKDLMIEHKADAFTIRGCMQVIIPIAETTACLPLSLLNDEGYLAFCESDFVVIPAGMLMHHMTGTPAFLNDPTWPHHGMVTLAHCTAPRKMDGKSYGPTKIYTHFESDYGAAPKVEMAIGQEVSMVIPDFESQRWLGAKGIIQANPFHDICRSQIDVAIEGNGQRLLEEMRGFHWMMVYGDCLKEVGYAIKHVGIEWENVSV